MPKLKSLWVKLILCGSSDMNWGTWEAGSAAAVSSGSPPTKEKAQ